MIMRRLLESETTVKRVKGEKRQVSQGYGHVNILKMPIVIADSPVSIG